MVEDLEKKIGRGSKPENFPESLIEQASQKQGEPDKTMEELRAELKPGEEEKIELLRQKIAEEQARTGSRMIEFSNQATLSMVREGVLEKILDWEAKEAEARETVGLEPKKSEREKSSGHDIGRAETLLGGKFNEMEVGDIFSYFRPDQTNEMMLQLEHSLVGIENEKNKNEIRQKWLAEVSERASKLESAAEKPAKLEEDPKYKKILESVALVHLQNEDKAYFDQNFLGGAESGYLLDRDGKETNLLPSMVFNKGLDKVEQEARLNFTARYPEDAKRYGISKALDKDL